MSYNNYYIYQHSLVTFTNQNGWTPLHDASDEGHVEVVKLLIKSGAQLDIKNKVKLHFLAIA